MTAKHWMRLLHFLFQNVLVTKLSSTSKSKSTRESKSESKF